jgi:hypothetical protein
MQTLTDKARMGRLAAIAHLSNRRAAARHFHTAMQALPLLEKAGRVISPTHYILH